MWLTLSYSAIYTTGINKPGGTGWVTNTEIVDDKRVCDVRYVLNNNTDHGIPVEFIADHDEIDRSSRRSRKRGADDYDTTSTGASASAANTSDAENGSFKGNVRVSSQFKNASPMVFVRQALQTNASTSSALPN